MWVSEVGYSILGTRLRVQSQDESVADEIRRLLRPFETSSPAARMRNTFSVVVGDELALYRDCVLHMTGNTVSIVLHLLMEANRAVLGDYSGFAAHAGVVSNGSRVAAVLGESGKGKSTLVASTVMAGLHYGSDEALCIDTSTTLVVPYARPLGLSRHSHELLGLIPEPLYADSDEAPVLAETLGGRTMDSEAPLTDLVLPERTESEPPTFTELSAADGVAGLLANSFNHYKDPVGSYRLTAHLAASCRIWRFTYSEPIAAGRALADHLAT